MPRDYESIASESLRALRGRRSQRGFSALFGFDTNVAYRWEAGLRYPTVTQLFGVLERIGRPVQPAFERVEPKTTSLRGIPADGPDFVGALLRLHRGSRSITELARSSGLQRLRVSRALSGRTQPRLPLFLQLLDALTGRVDEYVGAWVDLERAPRLRQRLEVLGSWRRLTYANPITEALTATLESAAYRAQPTHDDSWLAARLGIPPDEVRLALGALSDAGLVHLDHTQWVPRTDRSVDTRGDPERSAEVKRHWARVAADRVEHHEAKAAYLVFCCSEQATAALEELYRHTWSEARAILRNDNGNARVVLLNINWVPLDRGSGRAPSAGSHETGAKDRVTTPAS